MKGISGMVVSKFFAVDYQVSDFLNDQRQIGAQLVSINAVTGGWRVFYVPHNPKAGNWIGDDEETIDLVVPKPPPPPDKDNTKGG